MPVVNGALGVELLEHLGLVRLRVHLEARQCDGERIPRTSTGGGGERGAQTIAVRPRLVRLELPVLPVRIKRRPELLQQMRSRLGRQPDVPFETVDERRVRRAAPHFIEAPDATGLRRRNCLFERARAGQDGKDLSRELDPFLR